MNGPAVRFASCAAPCMGVPDPAAACKVGTATAAMRPTSNNRPSPRYIVFGLRFIAVLLRLRERATRGVEAANAAAQHRKKSAERSMLRGSAPCQESSGARYHDILVTLRCSPSKWPGASPSSCSPGRWIVPRASPVRTTPATFPAPPPRPAPPGVPAPRPRRSPRRTGGGSGGRSPAA